MFDMTELTMYDFFTSLAEVFITIMTFYDWEFDTTLVTDWRLFRSTIIH